MRDEKGLGGKYLETPLRVNLGQPDSPLLYQLSVFLFREKLYHIGKRVCYIFVCPFTLNQSAKRRVK